MRKAVAAATENTHKYIYIYIYIFVYIFAVIFRHLLKRSFTFWGIISNESMTIFISVRALENPFAAILSLDAINNKAMMMIICVCVSGVCVCVCSGVCVCACVWRQCEILSPLCRSLFNISINKFNVVCVCSYPRVVVVVVAYIL